MTKEQLTEIGYVYIGKIEGLELYTNINSKRNLHAKKQGYIFQFNPDYKEAIGQIFITKEILLNLVKMIEE